MAGYNPGLGGVLAIIVIIVGLLMLLSVVPMTPLTVGGSLMVIGIARLT